jgi:Immunity protein 50
MRYEVEPVSVVSGHEQLTSVFGGWPSFHDAEVLSVRLEREGQNGESPALYASIHVFAGRRSVQSPTGVEFYNHTVVTFRFNLILGLRLTEFNHQNAIFDLIFEEPPDAPMGAPLRVTFEPSFGIDCSFFCKSADIMQVERRLPANSVYE